MKRRVSKEERVERKLMGEEKPALEALTSNEKGGLTSAAGEALRGAWEAWGLEDRREEDKARRLAEKFLGKCERPGCRGNTGRVNQAYCPECKKRMEEEKRRKGRMVLGTQRGEDRAGEQMTNTG